MTKPIIYAASAALIDRDNRLLLQKRPDHKDFGSYWEFPGGKLLKHELPIEGLSRELKEEINIDICKPCFSPVSFLALDRDDYHLILFLYCGRKWDGVAIANEQQEIKWVYYDKLKDYSLLPHNETLIYSLGRHL
jgi:8-oxo-dGTP diphosphatase